MATKKSTHGKHYPSVAELRERVLAGDTVTEEEWTKARMRAELDELRAIADQRAAEQQAAEQRRQRVREIRETLLDAVRAVDDAPRHGHRDPRRNGPPGEHPEGL